MGGTRHGKLGEEGVGLHVKREGYLRISPGAGKGGREGEKRASGVCPRAGWLWAAIGGV